MTPEDAAEPPGTLAQVVGGVIGVTAALPFLGQDPRTAEYVQATITPIAIEVVNRLGIKPVLDQVRERNLAGVLGVTAKLLDEDLDDVARRISNDAGAARAFVEAARAAELTDSAAKLKALGEALSALLSDSAQLDDELWFMRQLAPLEAYHMRVLGCWVLTASEWDELRGKNGGGFGNRQALVLSEPELQERSGLRMAGSLAEELQRRGFLARVDPLNMAKIDTGYRYEDEPNAVRPLGGGHNAWILADLGTTLLDRVGGSRAWAVGGRLRDEAGASAD